MATSGRIPIATGSNSVASGSTYVPGTNYFDISGNIRLIVDWVLKSQDITNNTSTITVTMSVQHSKISLTSGSNDCSFTFGGVTRTWEGPNLNRSIDSPATTVLKDGTATTHDIVVSHAADGTFTGNFVANYRLSSTNSFEYHGQRFGFITNKNAPASITLPTIARKSSMTVSGSNVGSNITFTITRASSGFTHDISYKYGSTTTTIATGVGESYTWSGSSNLSLASVCKNAPSMAVTFILTTKSNGTSIGSVEYSRTLNFPEETFRPKLTIAVSEGSNRSSYLKGLSTVKVVPTATVVYSSSITSYSATIGSWSYSGSTPSTITSVVLPSAGTLSIKYRITNARGYSAERTTTITVLNYNPPTISNLTIRRVDANGNSDISGDRAYIEFRIGISSVPGDNQLSSGYPKGAYTRTSVAWGTNDTAITSFSYNSSTGYYYKTISLSADYSFNIRIQVKDKYSNDVYAYTTVSTAFALLHIPESGKGLGIGGIASEDRLQVFMPSDFSSSVSVGGSITFERGSQTGEHQIRFYNADTSEHHHRTYIYGGSPTSATTLAVWDAVNVHSVWYYQGESGVFGIMNTSAAIARGDVRILGKSMKSFLNAESLTLTRTTNDYVNATSFNRMVAYIKSGFFWLRGNLEITTAKPSNNNIIEIGRITGWDAISAVYYTVPAQNGSGVLGIEITASGVISIYNTGSTSVSGFCRFTAIVPSTS